MNKKGQKGTKTKTEANCPGTTLSKKSYCFLLTVIYVILIQIEFKKDLTSAR